MAKKKYYYAVVHRETGRLYEDWARVPIFYCRSDAASIIRSPYIIQKVNIEDLMKLILSHRNPKAV